MRAALASLVHVIWHALPLAYWETVDCDTLYRHFADSPRKRKPQRRQLDDGLASREGVALR
jgi:hypothetical protein